MLMLRFARWPQIVPCSTAVPSFRVMTAGNRWSQVVLDSLSIENFRSFQSAEVSLGRFNVLVGANAAGKSNFIDAIRFLRDVERHGLSDAVSMQGGVEYLRNAEIGAAQPLSVTARLSMSELMTPLIPIAKTRPNEYMTVAGDEATLHFEIAFRKRASTFKIQTEEITIPVSFTQYVERGRRSELVESSDFRGRGQLRLERIDRRLQMDVTDENGLDLLRGERPDFMYFLSRRPSPTVLTWNEFVRYFYFKGGFSDVSVFDFDPKLPKQSVQITGRQQLEEDGSNLALVLQSILKVRGQKRLLTSLVGDILPFIERFSVQSIADRSVFFSLHDKYGKSAKGIPAAFMSDGTINVLAIICAAVFDRRGFIVIEEPERNIHPSLISRVVALLREASQEKQVVITTHSPEVIKNVSLEELILVRRNKSGFSEIVRPRDSQAVGHFLETEIGLDDLFVQNLLAL